MAMIYGSSMHLLKFLQRVLAKNVLARSTVQCLFWLFAKFRQLLNPGAPKKDNNGPGAISRDGGIGDDLEDAVLLPHKEPLFQLPSRNSSHSVLPLHTFSGSNTSRSSQNLGEVALQVIRSSSTSSHQAPMILGTPLSVSAQTTVYGSAVLPGLSAGGMGLVPIVPQASERYERDVREKVDHEDHMISPLTFTFPSDKAPHGWTRHIHPEGALYFFNKDQRVVTEAYVIDDVILQKVEGFMALVFQYMAGHDISLTPDVHLALDLKHDQTCGYYFVDHGNRTLFWLDEYNIFECLAEVKVEYTSSHISHEIQSQYWTHNEFFPDLVDIPHAVIHQLKDTLVYAAGDMTTSKVSTAPYTQQDLQTMLTLVNEIESSVMRYADSPSLGEQQSVDALAGSACILYRLASVFAHERFLNLHGEPGARLSRDQSIHGQNRKERTYLMGILNPLFMFAPEVHMKKLEDVSVDSLMNNPSWELIRNKLTDEWKEFTLYATVLLNANVAFLAIQSVDESGGDGRSPAQRASYFSTVVSVGAIIIGSVLSRQHNTTLTGRFLLNRSISAIGLESLALMYSLPYTLLMWGMMSFLLAFSLMCYSVLDLSTYVLTACGWFALVLFLFWCISVSYETRPYYYPWPARQWKKLEEQVRGLSWTPYRKGASTSVV